VLWRLVSHVTGRIASTGSNVYDGGIQIGIHMEHIEEEPDTLAESDLKAALMLADFARSAYFSGRLQHAVDFHSKAKWFYTRGTTRLSRCILSHKTISLEYVRRQVRDLLSHLRDAETWYTQAVKEG